MKKKIALILVLCIMATVLCSCSINNNKYPYVSIVNTMWKLDNLNVPIGNNYSLDVRKPYEITFSDDGAIVNIYFMKKGIE